MIRTALLLALASVTGAVPSAAEPTRSGAPVPSAQPAQMQGTVAVLGYGKIAEKGNSHALSAESFARQMRFLAEQNIQVISAETFLAWRSGKAPLPAAQCVLITLDEADAPTCLAAAPVLKKMGFPYIVFADARSFANGGTERLQQMQRDGAAIGSHTLTRPANYEWQFASLAGGAELKTLTAKELGKSAELVRSHCGECRVFSYPNGYTDAGMVKSMAAYGYEAAFCAQDGKVSLHAPAYRLHRYMVNNDAAFCRAVNFGKESEAPALFARLQGMTVGAEPAAPPAPAPITPADTATEEPADDTQKEEAASEKLFPAPLQPVPSEVVFDDDAVAEEVEDEEPAEEARPLPGLTVAAARIARPTPVSDWVTTEFTAPLVPREQTRVAVLGYHNFSNVKSITEMRMRTSEFCEQMQYIHDAGISVITMEDFLQWLRGDRCLPERCVLITIDDGWKSVYTDAYPVLKAYGYPFTVFLYTAYVDVKGDSMSKQQIEDMMANGATVGSHSSNHLYPRMWKRYAQDSDKYLAQVQTELLDSATKLKSWFGNCSAYCYPGGYNTQPMLDALENSDYRAAFTVLEAKVTCEESPYLVHRYMVFGNDSRIFRRAVNFDGDSGVAPTKQGIEDAKPRARAFFPKAFADLQSTAPKNAARAGGR